MSTAPQPQPDAATQRVLGVQRSAVLETLGFYAAALAIDALVLGGDRYVSLHPHPFFLFTLLIAAHYGTGAGVMSVLLGTLLAFLGNLPPRDPLHDQSVYLLQVAGRPVLWFACAVILGELRTRRERALEDAQRNLATAQADVEALRFANASLELSNQRMHAKAAGQVETTVSLIEAAKAIETRETRSVFASVDPLVQRLLAPNAYSIYLRSAKGLELVTQVTDGTAIEAAPAYAADAPLVRAVIDGQQVVHVAGAGGQELLAGAGVMAGPLVDMESGTPLGMLKIEGLPLEKVRPDSVHLFTMLCEWIGGAYTDARKFEDANQSRVVNQQSQLFTDAYYQPVSTFVIALAERAHFPVTQMMVRMEVDTANADATQTPLPAIVQRAVEGGLRTTDLAFDYYAARNEFVVMLPMTPVEHGQRVADRLRAAIERQLGQHAPAVHLSVTYEALYIPGPQDLKPWHRAVIRRTDPYVSR